MEETIVYTGVVIFAVLFKVFSKYYSPRISRRVYPKYANLDADLKLKWDSHVVSTIHAAVVTICALWLLAYDWKMELRPEGPAGRRVRLLTGFSAGYFLHDLVMMLRYHYLFGKRAELAHHVISLSGTVYITLTGQIPWAACMQLFHELSTPLVNMRWFILTAGIGEDKKRYKMVCISMMVLFFLCRILTIPVFWYKMWPLCMQSDTFCNTRPIHVFALVFAGMDMLNLHWFRLMTRIFTRVIKDKIREVRQRRNLHFILEESDDEDASD